MTARELAGRLNGRQYRAEITEEEEQLAKQNRLVVVFGASDDLVELRGAINDELDAYEGTEFLVEENGIVKNECDEGNDCPNFTERGMHIEACWDVFFQGERTSWLFKTEIPHEKFLIREDDLLYCVGIVFSLKNLAPKQNL